MCFDIFDIFVNCEFVIFYSPESEHFMHYLFVCLSVCLSVSVVIFLDDCPVWRINVLYKWRLQKLLSKTYVKKSEAGRLIAEVLRSSRAVIDAKLDQWNTVLSQQAESRDQTEQVRDQADNELRQSYDNLRRELQVTTDDNLYYLFITRATLC